jgi:hypothetical protein
VNISELNTDQSFSFCRQKQKLTTPEPSSLRRLSKKMQVLAKRLYSRKRRINEEL